MRELLECLLASGFRLLGEIPAGAIITYIAVESSNKTTSGLFTS